VPADASIAVIFEHKTYLVLFTILIISPIAHFES
jgi:hypothetical protein